jgi:hypothetical protein
MSMIQFWSFAAASLFGVIGGSLGAVAADECEQASENVDSCDWCTPWVSGPPTVGLTIDITSYGCQETLECAECCYEIVVEVGGPTASGASIGTKNQTYYNDVPVNGVYTQSLIVTSPCLTSGNTYKCVEVAAHWVVGTITGADGKCLRITCQQCEP